MDANEGADEGTHDFYCDEVLSCRMEVTKVMETETVLAFHHARPSYPVHIVVIPKRHLDSLLTLTDEVLMVELISVVRDVARQVVATHGVAKVVTNLGAYQDSKHLHWHVIFGKPIR
jgi:histidine triad (HIT) family protein